MRRIRDALDRRAADALVGRERELSALEGCLAEDGPVVTFVHGSPGIGKTALLRAFTVRARARGARVVYLDGRSIEPSKDGFLAGVSDAANATGRSLEEVIGHLAGGNRITVITVDTYEVLRLLDSWIRHEFLPALARETRLILAGRYPPSDRWLGQPGLQDLLLSLPLEPLSEDASLELLDRMGVHPDPARRIQAFARGHPLALTLAAATVHEEDRPAMEEDGMPRVIHRLSRRFLQTVDDDRTREALVAASVVRRITVSLLSALLPDRGASTLYPRLRALPFVHSEADGLVIHDAVREAIAASTRAADPGRHRGHRRAAWRQLKSEVADAGRSELWRYTADMLYLIENPIVREAFFPSGAQELTLEPAGEEEIDDIVAIARRHEGPEAVDLLRYWWRVRPHRFRAVFDAEVEVAGFYLMLPADEARAAPQDPLIGGWLEHLEGDGPDPADTLFIRRWLSRADGESPSPVQAACWLDIKRTYMEMRPELRRVYLTVRDLAPYAEAAGELGFEPAPDLDRVLDGETYRTASLDFGPASVDGWLRELAATELGVEEESDLLDHAARELLVGDNRVALSPREYGVLSVLEQRAGEPVSRRELLERVWEGGQEIDSNVVDSVVYDLRRKLEDEADRLETVRGVGYRLRRR